MFFYSGVVTHLRAYPISCAKGRQVARAWAARDDCYATRPGGYRSCRVGSFRCRAHSPGGYTEDQNVRCRSGERLVTFTHGY